MKPFSLARRATVSLCAAALLTAAVFQQPFPLGATLIDEASLGTNAAASAKYLSAVRSDGALAYYRLADRNETLLDSGSHGINGSYGRAVSHNGPTITAMGTASAVFDGGNFNRSKLAAVPTNARLQPGKAVSVEAWVDERGENTTNQFVPIVAYGRQSSGPAYELMINPQNSPSFFSKTNGGKALVGSPIPLVPGKPTYIVATFDGGTAAVYVNGHLQTSVIGHGAINYSGLHEQDGLAIGGALDTGKSQFNGAIGHVAIYGKALSADEVRSHFVAGVQAENLNEMVHGSSDFVNTIGVNVHLHFTQSIYNTAWTQIRSLLLGLGVRHIRDGLIDTSWKPYYDRLEDLGRHGIKSTLTATRDESAAVLLSYPRRIPSSFEAYEAPNEQNLTYRHDANWPEKARAFQKMMYNAVKGNSATAGYRVLGPSITGSADIERVGNISRYMDFGNVHDYFGAYNPGTEGFGSHTPYGIVGSIDWNSNVESIMSGAHAFQATETGYNTGATNNNVPMDMQGKYLPRLMLEMYNHGIALSDIYELTDWDASDHRNNYGLVSLNLHPKPAYFALQSLIRLLQDSAVTAMPVRYTLGGDIGNVDHTLLRKSDGSYYLALWIETRDYLPKYGEYGGGARVAVAPQNVVVSFPRRISSASVATIEDSGAVSMAGARTTSNSTTVSVSNNVSIVRLTF